MFKLALRGLILSLLFIDFISIAHAGRVIDEEDGIGAAAPAAPAAPTVGVLRRSTTAPIPIPIPTKQQSPMLLDGPLSSGTPPLLSNLSSSPRVGVDPSCYDLIGNLRPSSASPALSSVASSPRQFPFGDEGNGFLPFQDLQALRDAGQWPGGTAASPALTRTSTSSTSSDRMSQDEFNGYK